MRHLVFPREILVRIGAAALTAAVAAPAGALAADGRKSGYPGLPAQSTQTQTPPNPAQQQNEELRRQRRQQEEQGEIRPANPSESQRRDLTPSTTTPVPGAPQRQQPEDVPPVTTPNQQLVAPTPLIRFEDVPTTRIGVDPNNVSNLTLQDAIEMALRRNLLLESTRYDTRIAGFNYEASKGVYDFNLTGNLQFNSVTVPVASVFGGAGSDFSVNRKTLSYGAGFTQLFERGGLLSSSFDNTRERTDSTASQLNPTYNPQLTFNFEQPLMRNFKIDAQRRNIRLARRQLDLTDAQFREQVIQTINSVQRAYWNLVYAIRNEQIQRESVELGRVQLENNLRQVEAGTIAPIELRSTEADLQLRRENVITSMQAITTAENQLKDLMLGDPGDPLWNARIAPADPIQFAPIQPDLDTSIRSAIVNRPELDQLKIQTQLREIDLEYYKDQTRPQLDLIASYGLQGLAGGAETGNGGDGVSSVFPSEFDKILLKALNQTRVEVGLPRIPQLPIIEVPTPGNAIPDRFLGGYFRSLGTLFSNDFRTWSVGVRYSFPLQNTTAEANVGRTQAELRQLDVRQRRLMQTIQVEVRNALQSVDAARMRYEAAQAARVAAEAQLRGEEEKFRAGLSTNYFVLERQNQLSSARGREAQALTDYNIALAELQRVTGTSMVSNNVTVETKPNP
jgi:outer membrane protein